MSGAELFGHYTSGASYNSGRNDEDEIGLETRAKGYVQAIKTMRQDRVDADEKIEMLEETLLRVQEMVDKDIAKASIIELIDEALAEEE